MLIPSVTQVIGPWQDFSRIPPGVLLHASERGTIVHDACANIARGLFILPPEPEIAGYVDSFRAWFDLMVAEVLLVEERLVDMDLGFSGQLDLIVIAKNAECLLVDLKTPPGLKRAWRAQLAGYHRLAVIHGHAPDRVGSLRLSPEGKMAKMDWYDPQGQDLAAFLSCLNCFRYFHGGQ